MYMKKEAKKVAAERPSQKKAVSPPEDPQRTSQANDGNRSMMEQVTAITKASEDGDEWQGSLADLRKLVDIGACHPDDNHNESPTIGDFLEELAPYGSKVRLEGRVRLPPREGEGVSVEGFTVSGLTADELLALYDLFRMADEAQQIKHETYSVRFWWD
jgi:hypothetical protein